MAGTLFAAGAECHVRDLQKEGILQAAIRLAEQRGIEKLTMRSIAAEAGIDPAELVFQYRDKVELIHAMLVRGLGRMIAEAASCLERPWPSRHEGLSSLLSLLIGRCIRYPRLASAILRCPAGYLAVGPSPRERLQAVVLEATRDLAHELGVRDEEAIAARAALLAAAVVFPVTEPELFRAGIGLPPGAAAVMRRDGEATFAAVFAAVLSTDAASALERASKDGGREATEAPLQDTSRAAIFQYTILTDR